MKVALFKDITWAHSTPTTGGPFMESMKEYARVSEYVEVEFPPLAAEAVVKSQLDGLDRAEQELRNQFQQKLDAINNRRAELQALTFVPAGE